MTKFSRTWWGDRFIKALEDFTDDNRLKRGRSYATGGKVLSFDIDQNRITARVKGSINPYFGVYKEPTYNINIEIKPIAKTSWNEAIKKLSSKASIVSRLLLNEVPENIEDTFSRLGLHLLPHSSKDFTTKCSCPDYANPCKHIAGVYYLVASQLDNNPFLLFELRGLSQAELQAKLADSPLGKALAEELKAKEISLENSTSFYTQLEKQSIDQKPTAREFWLGTKRLPQTIEVPTPSGVSAILIKKQGDFPAFWSKNNSFIETMEELYQRVKTKNQNLM
ncbi:SWIM zinc finger family protein [Nostocaceae cyanobacterium CENA357]|uniref:SWIM zinc finger family protein n=1 Tax=Atlanticothrix silvestris CENA357 TaxID=1725252 RepID=A0A8J7H8M6_9CYAN|nr:SWIM zinc finger family protein [Atlanticothrix silvestris]MBH8551907.1 SWIM zinc finger family protein [Atlanticothrix silvestris CENA357]